MNVYWSRFAVFGAALCALANARAVAHPLGNFTINHLAVFSANHGSLHVHYVLDVAEIPSFQIMHAGAAWESGGKRAWVNDETARVEADLSITSDGNAINVTPLDASAIERPGAGGLPTLYWTADFSAALPPNALVTVSDRVYADRPLGWRDISLPGHPDPTNELRSYPNVLIGSPRHDDAASFTFVRGRIVNAVVSGSSATLYGGVSLVRSSALSDLFSRRNQTPLLVLLTVLAAFGLGALHGLEPGHGKALLAFTLVGARATVKQAAILAGALTFAHTIAVLLLGLVLFFAAGFATENVFTWITLFSGLAVTCIGARSLTAAIARVAANAHPHNHSQAPSHSHEHPHSHAISGSQPLHFPTAIIAAMSGGIAPCPAAIVVLLTALHLHRVGYGLAMIVVFSLGLAAILTGLGFAIVHGAVWLRRNGALSHLAHFAPLLTACVISIIGATMLAQGLAAEGVRLAGTAVIGITLAAIAAIALVPRLLSSHPLTT